MFVTTRILNGIVALVALLLSGLFAFTSESSADMVFAGMLGLVVLLFGLDMKFRKENTSSDVGFAMTWTLLFAYPTYFALKVWLVGSSDEGEIDFAILATDISLVVLPFFLNGIYLVRLYLPQGEPK